MLGLYQKAKDLYPTEILGNMIIVRSAVQEQADTEKKMVDAVGSFNLDLDDNLRDGARVRQLPGTPSSGALWEQWLWSISLVSLPPHLTCNAYWLSDVG